MKKNISGAVRKMAEKQLRHEDEFMCFMFYQPKMPKGIEKVLKKNK